GLDSCQSENTKANILGYFFLEHKCRNRCNKVHCLGAQLFNRKLDPSSMKLRIVLSTSVKNCVGILMGIVLNLQIAFARNISFLFWMFSGLLIMCSLMEFFISSLMASITFSKSFLVLDSASSVLVISYPSVVFDAVED
ncbi:hypothetical protein STEG23_006718, partial [Scotinomys teguina]